MALDASTPFVWGSGGRRMTPEEILMERKASAALGQEAMSTAPVGHWTQGLNRVLQGLMAGYDSYSADQASKQNAAESSQLVTALLGGAGGATAPAATGPTSSATATAPSVSTPMGNTAIPAGREEFVNTIMPMAQEAAAKTGLDPRLIVAQAALESGWGKSAPGNNYFGIKSHGLPGGNTLPTTEVVNGQPTQTTDSFRAYASPADSVSGYADFILNNKRYAPVRAAQGLDAQAAALGQSGYATDPEYGQKVLQIARSLPQAPQVVDANQPSPLDTAQYPAGPVGGPSDPAALPTNATPTALASTSNMPVIAPQANSNMPVVSPQVSSNMPVVGQAPASGRPAINPAILQAMTSPYVSEQTRNIASMLYKSQMDQQTKAADPLRQMQIQLAQKNLAKSDEPTSVQEYNYYKENFQPTAQQPKPMNYDVWSTAKARAAATNITNNVGADENSFQKEAGKVQAQRFNDLVGEGQQAKQLVADIGTLTELGRNIGTGKSAQIRAAIGPYAEALGVKVEGLSDIQAYEAIVNRVAPSLRVKGSGAQSDLELKNFLKSLPSLGNTPEGNDTAAAVLQGLQQNKVAAADIASKALNGEITRAEADKQLRSLPDPMEPYRAYTKNSGPAAPAAAKVESLKKKYGLD